MLLPLLATTAAHAGGEHEGLTPPSSVQPATPERATDPGVREDASSPGAFLAPTALIEPAGTLSFTVSGGAARHDASELTSVSASYAATDRLTIGGGIMLPTESFRLGLVDAKWQVARSERVRVALDGKLLFGSSSELRALAGLVGATATACIDERCDSQVSGYLGAGIVDGGDVPVVASGSAAVQLVPHVKLIGELVTGFVEGDGPSGDFVALYGLRLTGRLAALNLGMVTPVGSSASPSSLLFVSVTLRTI